MASRSGGSSRNADPFAIPAAGIRAVIRVERSATIIIARRRKCIDGELACTTVTAEQLGADRQHGRNTAAQNLLGDERKLGFESNWELCMAQNEVGGFFYSSSLDFFNCNLSPFNLVAAKHGLGLSYQTSNLGG